MPTRKVAALEAGAPESLNLRIVVVGRPTCFSTIMLVRDDTPEMVFFKDEVPGCCQDLSVTSWQCHRRMTENQLCKCIIGNYSTGKIYPVGRITIKAPTGGVWLNWVSLDSLPRCEVRGITFIFINKKQ